MPAHHVVRNSLLPGLCLFTALVVSPLAFGSEELRGGFTHHGVATPLSTHRGLVATVDGQGRDVVLLWLYDHRGGYALLMIDAQTGRSETYPMPYPTGGDGPFASILSREQVLHPLRPAFLRVRPAAPGVHLPSLDRAADGHEHDRRRPGKDLVGHLSQ